MSNPRGSRSKSKSTTIVKKFNWEDCLVSEELATFGKHLEVNADEADSMEKEKLIQLVKDMSRNFTHAVSKETTASTTGVANGGASGAPDKRKEEARVQNRAANAKSAATAKGGSEEDIDAAVAQAVAKETKSIADKAKATAEKLEAQAKEAKEAAAASEARRVQSEQEAARQAGIAKAAHEAELAKKNAELQGTRARERAAQQKAAQQKALKAAGPAAAAGNAAAGNAAAGNPAAGNAAGDVPVPPDLPRKRKTDAERKEEYLAKGNNLDAWNEHERLRKDAAFQTAKKKAEAKYMPDLKKELETVKTELEAVNNGNDFLMKSHRELGLQNEQHVDNKRKDAADLASAERTIKRLKTLCKDKGATPAEIKAAATRDN